MPGSKLPENDREDKRGKGNIPGEYGWGSGTLEPFRLTGKNVKERPNEEELRELEAFCRPVWGKASRPDCPGALTGCFLSGGEAGSAKSEGETRSVSWKERAEQWKMDIPGLWLCLKAKETPLLAKVLAAVTVGYALSPIDLIPDFIPVLGCLDDLIILPVLTALTLKCIPRESFERYRAEASEMWKNGRPKKWYFALPAAAVWALFLWLLLRAIL